MPRLTAGVDLGGTKIQTVLVLGEKVVGSARVLTPQSGADAVLAAIIDSIKASVAAAGARTADLAAVGIGSPGTIDAEAGTVGHSPNVPGFETDPVPLGPEVGRALGGVEVKLDNDVRVAVLGEWKRGAGRPYRDLLGVFVGTGVGGGLILEGELREGKGAAGEIGHTIVKEGGRRCSCGQRGCLEAYAGRARIEATARRWQERGRSTKLFDIMRDKGRDRVTSGVIARALDRRDKVTVELVDCAVWALGLALANAQNLLDLEAIIVGGGLGDRLGEPFVERVEQRATRHLHVPERPPRFLPTELGDLSGAVGAAVLAGG
ncbi:MAG TPA: ROK family protein [Candidatus Dormibacteraeota bacterium]|nr:ROK family protein [Candidatus Dormibacteraeota bacterium]